MIFIICFFLFVFVARLRNGKLRPEDAFVCVFGVLVCLYTLFEHMNNK